MNYPGELKRFLHLSKEPNIKKNASVLIWSDRFFDGKCLQACYKDKQRSFLRPLIITRSQISRSLFMLGQDTGENVGPGEIVGR